MIGVVLCGGAGSRLWPISRELHPKPFIRLPDGESFLQKALRRGAGVPDGQKIFTVTNCGLFFKVAEEFQKTNIHMDSLHILEPFGRNTAPAIIAAALEARRAHGEDCTLLVLPADHLITKKEAFYQAVAKAEKLAMQDRLVVFGIAPTSPETGYGYIEADGDVVVRFVEKPGEEDARKFVEMGNFYWNSGMFCFKASTILAEFSRYAPELMRTMENCFKQTSPAINENLGHLNCLELDAVTFAAVPNISIDYAVMEKSERVSVVPCDIGWSDVGSWSALAELEKLDENGNHISSKGKMVLRDVNNTDIYGDKRLITALGVENLLIVDTPDALLVADKSRTNEVKEIYETLKTENHQTFRQHNTVYTPWGSYTNLETGNRFKIKRLTIKPGASISLQMHHHRHEHWIVVSGMAEVTCGDAVANVDTNESIYIKAGIKHRVANNGIINLVLIEVQSGDYLGEDDIVRFEDKYGRRTTIVSAKSGGVKV